VLTHVSMTALPMRRCEALLEDQHRLTRFADGLSEKLAYFNELDAIARTLGAPGASPADELYRRTLDRIDECVAFVQRHLHYHDAPSYLVKFRVQQMRALSAIKQHVVQLLGDAGRTVRERTAARIVANAGVGGAGGGAGVVGAMPPTTNGVGVAHGDDASASVADDDSNDTASEATTIALKASATTSVLLSASGSAVADGAASADASLFYARFRALAPRLRPLIVALERRAGAFEE
jgi:hypothetical protein